ncbi:Rho GTPase activation protein [Basidiobolus meristosporus CBS 931.73]|uniref:Rho GTPase activation protein n=1 Tax=Basidiobolus meristosporus CBS 931.73 TaxID=1314790 RepID=A0A1Y1YXK5_9FUNG|nr:Rho GTPase activation protein [Basidiobolus meristosporus CBS 931.73]|eukprot:ORY02719.1 Rho GTPase activation protein [Basidiobolus meristosporus CBS 931.73]
MAVEQRVKPNRWEQFARLFRGSENVKPNLRDRWKEFLSRKNTTNRRVSSEEGGYEPLFGVSLNASSKYATTVVNIGRHGNYVNCSVPTVVAECGSFLKNNGISTTGVFRINGSAKRVRQLQEIFNTGPLYGRDTSLDDFTVHDVANLLRRYLNCLPEPVISPHLYFLFRKAYDENASNGEMQILVFQNLLSYLPRPNQVLLLYLLNLLGYFAEHQETTLMDVGNLATIFQPSILAHPSHILQPIEYRHSSLVVKSLIELSNHLKIPPYHDIPLPLQPIIEYDYSQKITKERKIEILGLNPLPRPPIDQLSRSLSLGKRKYIRKPNLMRSDSQKFLQKIQESEDSYQLRMVNVRRSATLPGKQRRLGQEHP